MTGVERTGTELVDGIPILWCAPGAPTGILVHVPAFAQPKERAQPVLEHACSLGFAAAALDAYQTGARGTEDREAITRRVFANFRREMWTIIGETTLDVPRVADWARARFGGALPLHLTGLSMGGDVVVSAAPLIDRVASVNAVIATPDWQRPGMRDIATGELVEQGAPDAKARFFFDGLQPLSHPERYRSLPVHFIVGELDTHVPPEAAYRFQAAVNGGATSGEITVTELPGLKHLDFVGPVWFQHLAFGSRTRPAR
jgi:alpha-beta hydrolase superfamily lysophospholipase